MGKRSSEFERHAYDYYPTPLEAVVPLLPFLSEGTPFYEPCAGDASLACHLVENGHVCVGMSDIAPSEIEIAQRDARELTLDDLAGASMCITNPPWDTKLMHPILEHLLVFGPVWLLLYGDWLFTKQAAPYIPMAQAIVPIGRVKWIPDSPHTGKDNCCWVRFGGLGKMGGPVFWPRQ